jgi:hypothetical protein
MRRIAVLVAATVVMGCHSPPPADPAAASDSVSPMGRSRAPAPTIRPLGGATGRITSVNESLRFVVVDYSLNAIPEFGRRVPVFRGDQAVGELKITGPIRDAHVIADIVSGEPRPGDEARLE